MKNTQSVTSLPVSPDEDRRRRMLQYTVAMSIRMVCVLLLFFVHGWWLLVVAIGAVVLPYIGVVLANNGKRTIQAPLQAPAGAVTLYDPGVGEPTLLSPDDAFTGDIYTVPAEPAEPTTPRTGERTDPEEGRS
jgi:hypothetical protein